ncbi:unnamed protein product [Notodromas monacha]|uniref:PRELI/MSF1 domain-containing protein n=1 Tax=Notodromas monacha TaxID=399045 RepID=A0A7R9BGJ6_9CRUS|nr:unnamed protein product [Notodromas monacha]CAG0914214.1 unnamed protein product [Notodromas monacha]
MKIWTSEHVFNHSWETVAQAAWRKYPNPINPAVWGTDVVDRHVDPRDGALITHRIISSQWGLPSWAASILGNPSACYASEVSRVNASTRNFQLDTQNLTFGSHIAVDEKLIYLPHPDDPMNKTLLRQEAVVTVSGVPLTSYMESVLTNTISSNAGKGRAAMEWVIEKVNQGLRSMDDLSHAARKSLEFDAV